MIHFRRFFLAAVGVISMALGADVNLSKPIPQIKLTDGRTLRNVAIVTYAERYLTAKWVGGRGTLAYELFPQEYQAALEERRPKPPPLPPLPAPPAAPVPVVPEPVVEPTVPPPVVEAPIPDRKLTGQVYIVTRGAGPQKFANVTVAVYPMAILEDAERLQRDLHAGNPPARNDGSREQAWLDALKDIKPIATAQTDKDGKYALSIPGAGDVFVFCYCTRAVGAKTEHNLWVVKSGGSGMLDLTNRNLR